VRTAAIQQNFCADRFTKHYLSHQNIADDSLTVEDGILQHSKLFVVINSYFVVSLLFCFAF